MNVERFFKRHPGIAAVFAVTVVFFAACVWPGAVYGGGWAIATLAIEATWLTIILVDIRRPHRLSRRATDAYSFGFVVLLLVGMLFPLLAFLIGRWVPAWGALGIALAIALLLTILVWPAQMAYMRSRRTTRS